jgi:hypothetical protein
VCNRAERHTAANSAAVAPGFRIMLNLLETLH